MQSLICSWTELYPEKESSGSKGDNEDGGEKEGPGEIDRGESGTSTVEEFEYKVLDFLERTGDVGKDLDSFLLALWHTVKVDDLSSETGVPGGVGAYFGDINPKLTE